ncbi:hypothetical protein [Tenacibaculum ovolyticum]|uniref:hypothetical protein n=1 Tax=Tenacibaculum ovolyticum TaxID=104270 RepID=UPI0007EDFA2E|nr:hypothetical protein [Tenacibaculum ovolyticum]
MMSFFEHKESLAIVKVVFCKENVLFNYTKVYRHGETLEIDKGSFYNTDSVEELKEYVKKQPVILIFSGDKILYSDNYNLFRSSEVDFYSTSYENVDENKFLAFIRKGQVDNIVDDFLKEHFFILNIYVGVLTFNLLYEGNSRDSEELIDAVSLSFNKGELFKVKTLINEFVDSKNLTTNSELLILSSVFNFFYPSKRIINNYENEFVDKNRDELKHKTSLKAIVKIGVIFLFVIIIIAYLIGVFFENKNLDLRKQLNSGVNKERLVDELLKEEHQKKEMLELSGFYKTNISSFYINEIIKVLPEEIRLSKLKIFPVENKTKENKKIIIREKMIIAEGTFNKVVHFNSWIAKLKNVLNVGTLDISKYKKENTRTVFEIHVFLK